MASDAANFNLLRFTESGKVTLDKQRRLILPKPWRLSSDKIAKNQKAEDNERPASPDELTYFYLMPWLDSNKQKLLVFDQPAVDSFTSWKNYSPFTVGGENLFTQFARYIQKVTLDSQWRMTINSGLCDWANLTAKKDGVAFVASSYWGELFNGENEDMKVKLDPETMRAVAAATKLGMGGGLPLP